jgi:peptidoglycan/LPS O-acetylase OafA/YrhL
MKEVTIDRYEQLQSDTIKLVRFPLIVGVVMLHVAFEGVLVAGQNVINIVDFPAYDYYKFFFDKVLSVRIPLYFFISGYLFFNRADNFTVKDYIKKIRRRKDTLLIPYLSWIILTALVLSTARFLLPNFVDPNGKYFFQWSLEEFCFAFWSGPDPKPLWYVRDLLCIMVLSPIFYYLIKRFKIIPVIIFTLLWIVFETTNIPGLSLCGFAFFGFGAYFSITKRNFVRTFAPYSWQIYGFFAFLAFGLFALKGTTFEPYFNRLMTPVGSICVVLICSHLLYKNVCKPSDTLANASFFIYMYHCLLINPLLKIIVKLVRLESSKMLICTHILATIIVVGIGLLGYLFIRRYSPLLLKVLSGGR